MIKKYEYEEFLSYGHDSDAPLIEKIKELVLKDAEGYLKLEARKDLSHEHRATCGSSC